MYLCSVLLDEDITFNNINKISQLKRPMITWSNVTNNNSFVKFSKFNFSSFVVLSFLQQLDAIQFYLESSIVKLFIIF